METLDFLASFENTTDTCEYFREILDIPETVDILFCMILYFILSLNFTAQYSYNYLNQHLFSN